MRIVVSGLVVLICVAVCNGEIFTALATMKRALYIQQKLAEELRNYASLIPDKERSEKVAK